MNFYDLASSEAEIRASLERRVLASFNWGKMTQEEREECSHEAAKGADIRVARVDVRFEGDDVWETYGLTPDGELVELPQ